MLKLKAPNCYAQQVSTDKQTDRRTDGRYQTYYLPCFAVDNNISWQCFDNGFMLPQHHHAHRGYKSGLLLYY